MHTIESLYAQSITADRISRAAAHRAARASAPPRPKPRPHLRRLRRVAAPSV